MELKVLLGTMITILLLITLVIAAPVMANSIEPPPGMGKQPKEPPPEAFAACEGRKTGDSVTVVIRQGEQINAVCESLNNRLVARPILEKPPKPQE